MSYIFSIKWNTVNKPIHMYIIITLITESKVASGGRKMGSKIFDTKRSVIKGTPRTISIKPMHTHLMSGSLDLRPRASKIPTGSDRTIPDRPTIKFSMNPPNLSEATLGSPNPPTRRMVAIKG